MKNSFAILFSSKFFKLLVNLGEDENTFAHFSILKFHQNKMCSSKYTWWNFSSTYILTFSQFLLEMVLEILKFLSFQKNFNWMWAWKWFCAIIFVIFSNFIFIIMWNHFMGISSWLYEREYTRCETCNYNHNE